MKSTDRTNQSLLLHNLQINSIKRFQVVQKDHIELKWFRHIEGFSKVSEVGGGRSNDEL
jgi:hypothetical protein